MRCRNFKSAALVYFIGSKALPASGRAPKDVLRECCGDPKALQAHLGTQALFYPSGGHKPMLLQRFCGIGLMVWPAVPEKLIPLAYPRKGCENRAIPGKTGDR